MSNISDERLIVDAVKGNTEAIKGLKNRVQSEAGYAVRHVLKHRRCSNVELESQIVPEIVQTVLNTLPEYGFNTSLQILIYRLTVYFVESNQRTPVAQHDSPNGETKACFNPRGTKHPPLEQIDVEIRSLVSLLNRSADIRTTTSCSGHPNREAWKIDQWVPYGGYIGLCPIGSPRKTLDFLIGLLTRLDNSSPLPSNTDGHVTPQNVLAPQHDSITSTRATRKRYKQVAAEALFDSGEPIVLVDVSFSFFVGHCEEKYRLEIWKHVIAIIKELIPEDEELSAEVDTIEMAAQLLQKALQRLPFLFSATLLTSQKGYPGIALKTTADLALCQWFAALAYQLSECLNEAGYMEFPDTEENTSFSMKWTFRLRPFLSQELIPLPHLTETSWTPRTRDDHLKIWKLLELAVAEQLDG